MMRYYVEDNEFTDVYTCRENRVIYHWPSGLGYTILEDKDTYYLMYKLDKEKKITEKVKIKLDTAYLLVDMLLVQNNYKDNRILGNKRIYKGSPVASYTREK